jgi:hypothetical protein
MIIFALPPRGEDPSGPVTALQVRRGKSEEEDDHKRKEERKDRRGRRSQEEKNRRKKNQRKSRLDRITITIETKKLVNFRPF